MMNIKLVLLVVVGCIAGAGFAKFIPATSADVAHIGRYAIQGDHSIFAWPGVHIETKISGTSQFIIEMQDTSTSFFDVLINGNLVNTFQTQNRKMNFTVSTQFPSSFVASIVRRTETFSGVASFFGVYVSDAASASPAPRPSRRIEYYGDSITCGYGNMGTFPCSFTINTENARLSHGYVTAEVLEADVMITAWSGIGVIRNYGENTDRSANPLPSFYTDIVGQNKGYGTWDFTKWVPQAIVINLGTNDFSGRGTEHDLYQSSYIQFIKNIQQSYKGAPIKIFLSCGPMSQAYCPDLPTIAQSTGALVIPSIAGLPQNQLGCDYHPNSVGDETMAKVEAPFIKQAMGW